MNYPDPKDDDTDLLSKLLFSGKPYDPCDWLDPRNSFLFEDEDGNQSVDATNQNEKNH